MIKIIKKMGIFSGLMLTSSVFAAIPNTDNHPSTFIGPNLRGGFTGLLTDESGYSFAAEVGPRNIRGSVTAGFSFVNIHHLKFTGEYLWQKVNYPFFAGIRHNTIDQGAAGIEYLLDINPLTPLNPQFKLNAFYSDAASAKLTSVSGTYVSDGVVIPFVDQQRIADANALGFSPGIIIEPWRGAKTGFALNYDSVHYNTKFSDSRSVKGFGGTINYDQRLTNYIGFGAEAQVRKPFNNYQANVAFNDLPYFNNWVFKVIGSYTNGKSGMPNTYNALLSADYFLDRYCDDNCAQRNANQFMDWLAKPAVYMPQVLAISEDNVS